MTTITSDDETHEIVIGDILRFLWAWKAFVVIGFGVGLLLAYPVTGLLPDTIGRTVMLTIYPSGTPTDTADDIQNQLWAALDRQGFPSTKKPGLLTVSMPYSARDTAGAERKFDILARIVADYRTKLLAKVSGAYFDLQQRENATGQADAFVKFRSFQDGVADASIDPVRITVAEKDRRHVIATATVLSIPLLGALSGALVAWAMAYFSSATSLASKPAATNAQSSS